jgi:hypothetical protein
MTEEQKIQALEAAIYRYRAEMTELKRQFNESVEGILNKAKARKLKEIRQKITSNGK